MFVAESGVRIFLSFGKQRVAAVLGEPYRFLRAVLYTSETEFAIAVNAYASGSQFVVAARTHLRADSAAYAGIGNHETRFAPFYKTDLGVDAAALQEHCMLLALHLRYRFMLMLVRNNIAVNALQILWNMFVDFNLLVHIEIGQPVIHYSLNIFSEIPFYRLSLYISNLQMFSFNLNTHEISRF